MTDGPTGLSKLSIYGSIIGHYSESGSPIDKDNPEHVGVRNCHPSNLPVEDSIAKTAF